MSIESELRDAFYNCMVDAGQKYPAFAAYRYKVALVIKPNMGRSAGKASIHNNAPTVYLNRTLAVQNMKNMCEDTIPHEIAHIICMVFNWDKGHGFTWRRVAKSLGCNGERCFNSAEIGVKIVPMRKRTKYLHRATCGTEIWLSDVMHGKLMKGFIRTLLATRGNLSRLTYLGKVK